MEKFKEKDNSRKMCTSNKKSFLLDSFPLPNTISSFQDILHCYSVAIDFNRSDLILVYGSNLLRRFSYKLQNGKFDIMERVLIASLELGIDEWTEYCCTKLESEFPDSKRVSILNGMILEHQEKYDDALSIYKSILSMEETNMAARHRILAVVKKTLPICDILHAFNTHLIEFCNDESAWYQLGSIYIQNSMFNQSLFCFEELLSHNACDKHVLITTAELNYTLGVYPVCWKLLCRILELDRYNLRAMWSLLCVDIELSNANATRSKTKSASSKSRNRFVDKKSNATNVQSSTDDVSADVSDLRTHIVTHVINDLSGLLIENSDEALRADKNEKTGADIPLHKRLAFNVLDKYFRETTDS